MKVAVTSAASHCRYRAANTDSLSVYCCSNEFWCSIPFQTSLTDDSALMLGVLTPEVRKLVATLHSLQSADHSTRAKLVAGKTFSQRLFLHHSDRITKLASTAPGG